MNIDNISSIKEIQTLRDQIMQDRGVLEAIKYLQELGHTFQADVLLDWVNLRVTARDESNEGRVERNHRAELRSAATTKQT